MTTIPIKVSASAVIWAHLLFAALGFGQVFEVKDRTGVTVLTLVDVEMFQRYYDGNDVPDFHATVKNVSGTSLTFDGIKGAVHKEDGSTAEFTFNICESRWCELPKGSSHKVSHSFSEP